jgi:hypothetical protein
VGVDFFYQCQGNCVVVHTYENQRFVLAQGWNKSLLLPSERKGWSDDSGSTVLLKENFLLPSDEWTWDSNWIVDMSLRESGEVDEEGWQYALSFDFPYSGKNHWTKSVRRRRWIRVRRLIAKHENRRKLMKEEKSWSQADDEELFCSVSHISICQQEQIAMSTADCQRPTLHRCFACLLQAGAAAEVVMGLDGNDAYSECKLDSIPNRSSNAALVCSSEYLKAAGSSEVTGESVFSQPLDQQSPYIHHINVGAVKVVFTLNIQSQLIQFVSVYLSNFGELIELLAEPIPRSSNDADDADWYLVSSLIFRPSCLLFVRLKLLP